MRKILIVGAGQAGLQLALTLQAEGYTVTVVSARTPEEIRGGRITSTQGMFGPSLVLERDAGLNLWESYTPPIHAVYVTVAGPPGTPALSFVGPWDEPAQSVDQRVKFAGWLELFEQRGGTVIYQTVKTSDLEELCGLYDLTIIAAGKGQLGEMFDRDQGRSVFTEPQRKLAAIYVHGMAPRPDHPTEHVGLNITPGVGELYNFPAYTTSGPCDILLWEAVPGGPADCWDDRPDPHEQLERTLKLMREYVPWEYERCAHLQPTDELCNLVGGYAPFVRHPVARLSDTAAVLGMADVVVTNDPIAGQGANNAAHAAHIYRNAILDHGDRPFDTDWMQATFEAYWDYAQHSTVLSNMLLMPPPDHVQRAMGAAVHNPAVAHRFARIFVDPPEVQWLTDPAATDAYLASVAEAPA
jgi:hypothetical protein